MNIGFWRTQKGFISHKHGLDEEQVKYLQNLKVGDRLALFTNDVRDGERQADMTLKRSTLPTEPKKEIKNAQEVGK